MDAATISALIDAVDADTAPVVVAVACDAPICVWCGAAVALAGSMIKPHFASVRDARVCFGSYRGHLYPFTRHG